MKPKEFQRLQQVLGQYFGMFSQIALYKWPDDFARQEARDILDKMHTAIRKHYDLSECTGEQLVALGCGVWNNNDPTLYLLPLHLVGALQDGIVLDSIDNEQHIVGKSKLDLDSRVGLSAFGFLRDKPAMENQF